MAEARRLRQLVEFERTLASELSYELLFKRAVEAAAALGQAGYAAIGLLDPSGTGHERIVVDVRGRTRGDEETEQAAAVLALVAKGGAPLRLDDVATEGDIAGLSPAPRAVTALLGVPIARRDVSYGHLCVADRDGGGPFTGEDEELIVLLAAQVAVAIENARLYEAASSHARLLESLDEIRVHLAEGDDVPRVLAIVTCGFATSSRPRESRPGFPTGSVPSGSPRSRATGPPTCVRCRRPPRRKSFVSGSATRARGSTPPWTIPRSTSSSPGGCRYATGSGRR